MRKISSREKARLVVEKDTHGHQNTVLLIRQVILAEGGTRGF